MTLWFHLKPWDTHVHTRGQNAVIFCIITVLFFLVGSSVLGMFCWGENTKQKTKLFPHIQRKSLIEATKTSVKITVRTLTSIWSPALPLHSCIQHSCLCVHGFTGFTFLSLTTGRNARCVDKANIWFPDNAHSFSGKNPPNHPPTNAFVLHSSVQLLIVSSKEGRRRHRGRQLFLLKS